MFRDKDDDYDPENVEDDYNGGFMSGSQIDTQTLLAWARFQQMALFRDMFEERYGPGDADADGNADGTTSVPPASDEERFTDDDESQVPGNYTRGRRGGDSMSPNPSFLITADPRESRGRHVRDYESSQTSDRSRTSSIRPPSPLPSLESLSSGRGPPNKSRFRSNTLAPSGSSNTSTLVSSTTDHLKRKALTRSASRYPDSDVSSEVSSHKRSELGANRDRSFAFEHERHEFEREIKKLKDLASALQAKNSQLVVENNVLQLVVRVVSSALH